jgi:hypothetical protein
MAIPAFLERCVEIPAFPTVAFHGHPAAFFRCHPTTTEHLKGVHAWLACCQPETLRALTSDGSTSGDLRIALDATRQALFVLDMALTPGHAQSFDAVSAVPLMSFT